MPRWILLSAYETSCAEQARTDWRSSNTPPRKSSTRVAIFNPDHLFEQADKAHYPASGTSAPSRHSPRNFRRLLWNFSRHHHQSCRSVRRSDEPGQKSVGLAYRSVSHLRLREPCNEVQKSTQSQKYRPYVPSPGFGPAIIAFAEAVVELQEKRHSADYDVMVSVNRSDAVLAIATAKAALAGFDKANPQEQLAFLALLLFSPR